MHICSDDGRDDRAVVAEDPAAAAVMQQQQQPAGTAAQAAQSSASEKQQLNAKLSQEALRIGRTGHNGRFRNEQRLGRVCEGRRSKIRSRGDEDLRGHR